ncbi:hypothetical protein BJ684DRAFT_18227 [Piptocephalis cylindrospora]|uniref:Uncharacterized protein n=1 Tax=Piptocephalis cylindrospora TaxID=1907219 RepID=A0A4P9YAD8_9FUNG|nr:hypothetical protein BJ684DRAFT_18227 [Piptocephalis cylindrospora]|eukprot:RKP15451.1 hypothetical protein BJ684DRAFT_18227 [Piptocephalis cylindrospora]
MQRRTGSKLGSAPMLIGRDANNSPLEAEEGSAVKTVKNLPLSQDLLQYYRDRIERHEEVLKEAEGHIEDIRLEHTTKISLETRLTARESEVAVLQGQLSEAQECVARERGRLFRIVADNDDLRARELAGRRKIRQLLLRLQDTEDGYETHSREERSREGTTHSVASTGSWEHPSCSSCSCAGASPSIRDEVSGDLDPSDLHLTISALKAQLEDSARTGEEATRRILMERRMNELVEEGKKLTRFHCDNTQELLRIQREAQVKEREAQEKMTGLYKKIEDLEGDIRTLRGQDTTAARNDHLVEDLQTNLRVARDQQRQAQEQVQDMGMERAQVMERMEARITRLTTSLQGLKKKRANELEGFGADGMVLLRQLRTFERLLVRCVPDTSDETVVNLFLSLAECIEAMSNLTRELQLASERNVRV